jgi:hypothetical protein
MITKSELLKNPETCASLYAFEISSGGAIRLKHRDVVDADPNVQDFLVVGGEGRVRTAWLKTVKRTCMVTVGPYDPSADDEDQFPIYYLPWEENRIVRTKLKRSRRVQLAAEPRVFFTANLNGCMVSVEGPADEPTVYHANVIDYKGSPGADPTIDEEKAKRRIGKKVQAMLSGYHAMSGQHDNRRKTYVEPGHITQYRYQVLLGRPSGQLQEERARQVLEEDDLALTKKAIGSVVTTPQSRGAVFGVRDASGKWAFYFQRQLLVRYSRVDGINHDGSQRLTRLYEDWSTLRCEKFWPAGPGVMRF